MTERENLLGRKQIISASILAVENAALVLDLCLATSGGDVALRTAVSRKLQVSDFQAEVILGMQVRRFAPEGIERMRSELAEVEQHLVELDRGTAR